MTRYDRIPPKLLQKTGELVLSFSNMERCMIVAIIVNKVYSDELKPFVDKLPKNKQVFEELEELLVGDPMMDYLTSKMIERKEGRKDLFGYVFNDFKKIKKFKHLFAIISKLQNKRNDIVHGIVVHRPGMSKYRVGTEIRKDNKHRYIDIGIKELSDLNAEILKVCRDIIPSKKERQKQRENIINQIK